MRLLSLDLGDRRTGIAVSDRVSRIVSPLTTVHQPLRSAVTNRSGERHHTFDADALTADLVRIIREQEADTVVLGLPLNMDGSTGPRAELVLAFADHLRRALAAAGLAPTLETFDERLTSAEADWQMAQTGLTHKQKKARRDALAAAAILRGYLDQSDHNQRDSGDASR